MGHYHVSLASLANPLGVGNISAPEHVHNGCHDKTLTAEEGRHSDAPQALVDQ
jgi:hypothetical protein